MKRTSGAAAVRFILTPLFMWVLALTLQGCGKPKEFAIREPIPFGKTEISVQRAEPETFWKKNFLAVFVKWTGPASVKGKMMKNTWVSRRYFKITDEQGKEYYLSLMVTEYSLHSLQLRQQPGAMHSEQLKYDKIAQEENYVMLFQVPEGKKEYYLLLKNPVPEKGQPMTAKVSLGVY